MAITLASIVAINVANAQKNLNQDNPEFSGKPDMENGIFFVKHTGIENQKDKVSIYNAIDGMKAISGEKNGFSIKYIDHLTEDKISPFEQTTVKNNSEKNYLHWIVINDRKNGIFVVERSENGFDFVSVGFKNRIGSSVPKLSYYFSDSAIPDGKIYYRILAIGEDGLFKYSDTVIVENFKTSSQVVNDAEAGLNQ